MYWVADANLSVDTDQVLEASGVLGRAAEALGQAAADAGSAGLHGEALLGQYGASSSLRDFVDLAAQTASAADALATRVAELASWHAYAAWIFGAAEDDAFAMFAAAGAIDAPFGARMSILSKVARLFPPLSLVVEPASTLFAGFNAVSAFTNGEQASGTEGFLLQRELSEIGERFAAGAAGIPWLVFAATGDSPLRQLAGSAARVAELPRRLGWQPSRLLVTSAPASHPKVAGPGGVHGGKYVIVSAEGIRDQAVIIPAAAGSSATTKVSVSLMSGVISLNLPKDASARGPSAAPPPLGIDGALRQMERPVQEGMVEILEHVNPAETSSAKRSWSVLIRGTKEWTSGGANPQDMLTNLQEVGGLASDQSHAVRAAMELAGIGPDEPVELIGHSQGGIVAANLAGDPEFTQQYRVASVLTAGSPVALAPISKVRSLRLENLSDPVPALDGRPNRDDQDHLTVYFSPDLAPVGSSAHGLETYSQAARGLEDGQAKSQQVNTWLEDRRDVMNLGPQTRTISTEYWVRRVT